MADRRLCTSLSSLIPMGRAARRKRERRVAEEAAIAAVTKAAGRDFRLNVAQAWLWALWPSSPA